MTFFSGMQCSKGYLNNDIESERLLTGDRFIRTGEYGLYDREGMIHILGHSEEFVKVDGEDDCVYSLFIMI